MKKSKPYRSMTEALRAEIEQSPESLNVIARGSGFDRSGLSKFMAGKSLRLDIADKVAAYLGLEVTKRKGR